MPYCLWLYCRFCLRIYAHFMGFMMPLMQSSIFINYVRLYRVLWLQGRYGGGKTALAYRIAYELCEKYGYRYIMGNTHSVWNDVLENIQQSPDGRVGLVMILDEGGLFLKTGKDVEAFLAFLRKLDIIILIPSVTRPSTRVCFFSVQRLFNWYSFGFPFWTYRFQLDSGAIRERGFFHWHKPTEIFGIYDTASAPTSDGGLNDAIQQFTKGLQKATGHKETGVGSQTRTTHFTLEGFDGIEAGTGTTANTEKSTSRENPQVDEIGYAVNDLEQVQEEISHSLSLLVSNTGKKRGRKR